MHENEWLAERFEAHRAHLRAVAYRMLGSLSDADDAVQEAWLRLSRSGASGVENLGGWLTTVVARVSLDMLRSRQSRLEEPLSASVSESIASREAGIDPEHARIEHLFAESRPRPGPGAGRDLGGGRPALRRAGAGVPDPRHRHGERLEPAQRHDPAGGR